MHKYDKTVAFRISIIVSFLALFLLNSIITIAASAPVISNPIPINNTPGVKYNSTLYATISDPDNNTLNITFSIYDGSVWKIISSYNNVNGATKEYAAGTSGITTKPYTEYLWKVRAVDSTGLSTENTFKFKTTGLLKYKWSIDLGYNQDYFEDQIMPLMGDVDNDGVQELIVAANGSVNAIDGKTGQLKWKVPGVLDSAVELVDLDADGTPEILAAELGPRVIAINGDGTIRWTTKVLGGEFSSLFPLIAYDLDGDGYPTIYFASEDTDPKTYTGNLSDYTGAISMIDHNGNVLNSTYAQHPCWGGMSLGDTSFDGNFELFFGDRKQWYIDQPSYGLQAFNASSLKKLWQRPDIHHSSPIPILIDAVGDTNLEVIATPIVIKGPMILNAKTGATIVDDQNSRQPTHTTPTVYDIDEDGHLEYISGTSYPLILYDNSTLPKDFSVFDLVTNKTEFRPSLSYYTTWSPTVGGVTADGKMSILAAEGNQGSYYGNFPLLIYDNKYNLIDQVDITGAGQLTPARVYDVDGDGYNEVVVSGIRGKIIVYDTPAPTPNPAPRTWNQYYSEYRQNAAIYVEPPGPKSPIINDTQSINGSKNVSILPDLKVDVFDFQKENLNISFDLNDGSGWVNAKNIANFKTYKFAPVSINPMLNYSTNYSLRVKVIDTQNHTTQKIYTFSTEAITCVDADHDGYNATGYSCGPVDCDDNVASIHPNAVEICDGLDNNCDGNINEGLPIVTYYLDADNDTFGNPVINISSCARPTGYVNNSLDCNDNSSSIKPGAAEICDGIDNNCNGNIDENLTFIKYYRDFDNDTFGNPVINISSCAKPAGYVNNSLDCNDNNTMIKPGAIEICDGIDNNCNGNIDENLTFIKYYTDFDNDTFGNPAINITSCSKPLNYVNNSLDCNDNNSAINPSAIEICDNLDNNCNGIIDENLKLTYYLDADSDLFGSVASTQSSCTKPIGYVNNSLDCNDENASINPNATEICDGLDNNCNGVIDENLTKITYYLDSDSDLFGNPLVSVTSCSKPINYVNNSLDCNDNNSAIRPGATEICGNGIDDNCNGQTDEGCTTNNLTDWRYRKAITIDHNKVAEDISNFPVLIQLDLSNHSNGNDIIFTDGINMLDYEIEQYNNGQLIAWVRTDISASTDKTIYIYYGNNNTVSHPSNVWDDNYVAVYHQNSIDSKNHNDGTDLNGVAHTDSKISSGNKYDGADDRTLLPQLINGSFTFEAWVNTDYKQGYVMSQRDTSGNGVFIQYYPYENNFQMYANSNVLRITSTNNTWHYIVGTYNGNTVKLYIDAGTPASAVAAITVPQVQTLLADRSATYGRAFKGQIDEIRISNTARTAGYITTTYNNQNAGFISLGAEESLDPCNNVPKTTYYLDADSDTFGNPSISILSCIKPAGYVNNSLDCNDNSSAIKPSAVEICDGQDNNCNGQTDEGLTTKYYLDSDNDLFGNPLISNISCTKPVNYVTDNTDCNDSSSAVNPSATESCNNNIDDNCDGQIDENCLPLTGWNYRKAITIDHTQVASDIANFPVLITINDNNLSSQAQASGNDIVFTKADGTTRLNHEIESYSNGKLTAWVKTDVSASTDTIIYMYYGNSTVSNSEQNVWDNNYVAVYHQNSIDSKNHNDGTDLNGVAHTDSKISSGNKYDGVDDRTLLPQLINGSFTFEAWVNTDYKQGYIMSQRDTSGHGAFIQYYPPEGNFQMYADSNVLRVSSSNNTWHYIVGTYDGSVAKLYVDTQSASTSATMTVPQVQTLIGDRSSTLARAFKGQIDEIRISNTARTAGYITTTYNNQNANFINVGIEES